MAHFKDPTRLSFRRSLSFDALREPSEAVPASGIYLCSGCGREEVAQRGALLPPLDHHRHTPSQGVVRWRLIVQVDDRPK